MAPAAHLEDIGKRFGSVVALEGARLTVAPGEIHGLLGENGAGKTTLARVLAGLVQPDRGRVEVDGTHIARVSAMDARSRGIAMVHQHFSLVPRFTGLENVRLANPGAWTDRGRPTPNYVELVSARADALGLAVDLNTPTEELGVGERQRLEILKALMTETSVLLLDEPTAVLTHQEVEGLFGVLRQLAGQGTAVVLIAHKLDEVLAVADRVTVLRRGRWVLTESVESVTAADLAEAMVGEPFAAGPDASRGEGETGDVVAELADVTLGPGDNPHLDAVSLRVRRGEIVGIAGVEGNGQRQLASVLAGLTTPDKGTVTTPDSVGWIPQDRTHEGLVGGFSIAENLAFALLDRDEFRRGPLLDWRRIRSETDRVIAELDVRVEGANTPAGTLSGGNQQKVLTGRELLRSDELLVAESPTRGLDVKATQAVRRRIRDLARTDTTRGTAPPGVVLISTDLDEVLELSDRIAVMVRGRLIPVPDESRTPAGVGQLMLGAKAGG